jgi:hypothetical protein
VEQQFVGLDVSQAETAVCVVDASGVAVWQGKCASTPEAIAATLKRRAPHVARIAPETGPLSAWHWRTLSAMGLPVVCIDARHAKSALAIPSALGRKHTLESPISSDGDVPDHGRQMEASHRVDEILPHQMGPQRGVCHHRTHCRLRPIE